MSDKGPSADASSMLRAAVDVLVFAPLGFGAMLLEDSPAAVERARSELSNARFIGRFAVQRGVAEVRERLDTATSPVPPSADVAESAVTERVAALDGVVPTTDSILPAADELALPDYDTLPAIDIVAKLDALSDDELDAIRRYESAHRQRRTVLGKLSQLAER